MKRRFTGLSNIEPELRRNLSKFFNIEIRIYQSTRLRIKTHPAEPGHGVDVGLGVQQEQQDVLVAAD